MSLYQHGRKTRAPKSANTFLATLIIAGVVILGAWWIVHKDIGGGSETKESVPIITQVGEEVGDKIKFDETYFTIELPSDWKFIEHKTGNNINAYIYHSTKKGGDDRTLMIHVDVMPQSYKVVKIQPISASGNRFLLGGISDECTKFGTVAERQSNAEFETKWDNVRFICDPIEANQTIGTGTEAGGIKATLGRHSYFFYFEDHNIRPDDKIFQDAVRSFVAK